MLDLGVLTYVKSESFRTAGIHFRDVIKPHLDEMSAEALTTLLRGIEENHETYRRPQARIDHALVKRSCDRSFGVGFDLALYPNFADSLR